jgi:hypothetical protein
MAVYLGSAGLVQLQRSGAGEFTSELNDGDVAPREKRFSFDFPSGTFITGDRLRLRRLNADGSASTQPLDFVAGSGWEDGVQHPDGGWYIHVDAAGGVRLYPTWETALRNHPSDAIGLQRPSTTYQVAASMADGVSSHCLGEVVSYELSTSRDAIDVTSLGDTFREQTSGLISGGGSIECFWDWQVALCSPRNMGLDVELAHYAHQLVLRQQLGSQFRGLFYLKTSGSDPVTEELDSRSRNAALFYAADCLITDVGMAFEPDQPIRSKIAFVTTGAINLVYALPDDYLLQENSSRIDLETGDGRILLEY